MIGRGAVPRFAPAPAARPGAGARRGADRPRGRGLQTDNVYVDPDADPKLTEAEEAGLRERIAEERAGPMYVVVVPEEIAREAGGDLTQALGEIAEAPAAPAPT